MNKISNKARQDLKPLLAKLKSKYNKNQIKANINKYKQIYTNMNK